MSVVFGFLIILIISVTVTGKVIHALGLDKEEVKGAPANAGGQGGAANTAVVAAIGAAVNQYRSK
jgi:oxaloacetate decarboxylase gamma subunit